MFKKRKRNKLYIKYNEIRKKKWGKVIVRVQGCDRQNCIKTETTYE